MIRKYKDDDFEAVSRLFRDTIAAVNAKDYTQEQLSVWVNNTNGLKSRREDLLKMYTLVSEENGEIVGFGSITEHGELDLLFVHKNRQRQGIASALCDELEKDFSEVTAFSSATAKPFFENRGYAVVKEQEVKLFGEKLKNYEMKKKNATR